MKEYDEKSHPYQRKVFWYVFITVLTIIVLLSGIMYYVGSSSMVDSYKTELKGIAAAVAQKISAEKHELITEEGQEDSTEYSEIARYFQTVIAANPAIDDIYTLRPTEDPNIMIFVVAGLETYDRNGDNYIDEAEMRPEIGEEYDITGLDQLKEGLKGPSVDKSFTYDKWGTWLSGYAPIEDANGIAVALVGVDYPANEIRGSVDKLLLAIVYSAIGLIIIAFFVSLVLSKKLARPFQILAKGLRRVSHGELDYQLPMEGKGPEMIFIDLFNKVLAMFSNAKRHEQKHHDVDE